uniref:Uncharacterized protein n=1 Tax=Panagrolaimus sp. JU765 TaxID=591449 RepID=A0AC34PUQ4_9BILA
MLAPEDARSANYFSLDTITGEIMLVKSLDREMIAQHILKVLIYERLDPSVSASKTVVVNVLDVNDCPPVFEKNLYFAEIKEDAPVGTTVLSVFAKDLDQNENGKIVYTLEAGNGSEFIQIDSDSGVISIVKKFDRELMSLIRLNVVASDRGSPPLSSQALVEINVLDVNDCSPQFEQDFYNFTIFENITIPSVIGKTVAVDADSGQNGKVHYSMVTTSTSDLISLDYDTGELTIRQTVQPRQSPISFLVRAKDSGQPFHSTTVHVQVNVIDINDHAPVFVSSGDNGHTFTVEENLPIGKEIGRLFAVDDDFGSNGEIRYSIVEGEGAENFELDTVSGELKTRKLIDREVKDKYQLKVMAEDRGIPSLNSTTILNIVVSDQNDNPPTFEHEFYNLTLSENTPRGKKLMHLIAHDADANSKIVYNIENMPKNMFNLVNLGNQGAILSLAQEFAQLDENVEITISATDQGGLQGKCRISIQIIDVNTPPIFLDNPISVNIPENSPIGFHVLKINAVDGDREKNAELRFSIDSDKFRIDEKTGLLTVGKLLDREEQAIHVVNILVSDSGIPSMSSSTVLEVILLDENDNAPQFAETSYEVQIPEDSAVGTSILRLKAVDPDEGDNGIVNYFLNDTDATVELGHFKLDSTSGLLQINRPLDREKIDSYILPVVAVDRGVLPQKTHTTVTVKLIDVNDCAPSFERNRYDFWITENSPIGTVVGTLRATDPDEGDNAKLEFKIFGGQDAKFFELETDPDQPGVVRLLSRTEFDYEAKTNQFALEVQGLSGTLSSTVPVVIHVGDANDNRPSLLDFVVVIGTFENELPGIEIGRMPSFDPDRNATLEHYLEDNDVLAVDEFSGKLILETVFRRQFNMEQKACVSDGPNTVCARCLISYVSINKAALHESITVQIQDMTVEQFLQLSTYQRFLDATSSINPTFNRESIRIFSVKEKNKILNVSFIVSLNDNVLSSRFVEESFIQSYHNVSKLFGHKISLVHDELCQDEPCPYFQKCKRSLKYTRHSKIYSTENFIMRSLEMLRTFSCECPIGFTTNEKLPGSCNQQLNLCYENPCLNNGTCVPLENDYRCECPADFTGEKCGFKVDKNSCTPFHCMNGAECHVENNQPVCKYCRWHRSDTDESCRLTSLSFNGTGLVVVPRAPSRFTWELSFSFATVSESGVLFFAGERKDGDYVELSIESGFLKAEISLGGQSKVAVKLPEWPENKINNGEWHVARLSFISRVLRLSIDDCDEQLSLTMSSRIGYSHCAVEAPIVLPSKCNDPAVSCHRSLDLRGFMFIGNRPLTTRQSLNNAGFIGCLKNVHLNGKLIDFSDFDLLEKQGDVTPGCRIFRPDICRFEQPCRGGAKCVDLWLGNQCRCPNRLNIKAPSCAAESGNGVSLFSEESYVFWRLPSYSGIESTLNFEFRTRERKTQVVVLEFNMHSQFFIFSIEKGNALVIIGQEQYFIDYPQISDGQWHSAQVHLTSSRINLTLDSFYHSEWVSPLIKPLGVPKQLYTGQAPSTSHPHTFQGCVRNVELHGIKLKPLEMSQARPGCQVTNTCAEDFSCPKNSRCARDWDRHHCACNPGFVGDHCIDACSIEGICKNEGFCVRSNSTRGYNCLCPDGFVGKNCEHKSIPRTCPQGFYGKFSNCKKCSCAVQRGYKQQCDVKSGRCLCQTGTFEADGRCKLCECGIGSSSLHCDAQTGQCPCVGESTGRKCDRCKNNSFVLDRKTLKCVKIHDRCSSEFENGIQWPSTLHGSVARQSCPGNQLGIAVRKCSAAANWQQVEDYNCTLSQLYDLTVKIGETFDVAEVNRQLRNISSGISHLKNRNIDFAVDVFEKIVQEEAKSGLSMNRRKSWHLRDSQFTKDIVEIVDVLLDTELNSKQFTRIVTILYDYGILLTAVHEAASYLKSFQILRPNLVFVVDRLDSRNYPNNIFHLPKYDQFPPIDLDKSFADDSNLVLPYVNRITLNGPDNFGSSTAFYSIIPKSHCIVCEHTIVLVHHLTAAQIENYPETIQITFETDAEFSWQLPECVWLDYDSSLSSKNNGNEQLGIMEKLTNVFQSKTGKGPLGWRNDGTLLIGLNNTHVICQYHVVHGGIFSVISRSTEGSLAKFPLSGNRMTFISALVTVISLALCLVSLFLTLFKRSNLKLIRATVIFSFTLNILVYFVIRKMTFTPIHCSFRNFLLTFVAAFNFSWLFLYSLQVYNAFIDSPQSSCRIIAFIVGILIPGLISATNFFYQPLCTSSFKSISTFIIIGPALFYLLLNFYALSTSFLVSLKKQYFLISAKYSLKKTLIIHCALIIACVFYDGTEFYLLFFGRYNTMAEMISTGMLLLASVILFIWSTQMVHQESTVKNEKATVWTNETFPKIGATSTLPNMGHDVTDRIYDGPPGEWMPDLLQDETYVHHTLQRSLQLPSSGTLMRKTHLPQVPQILSPAQKVFGSFGEHTAFSIAEDQTFISKTETPTSASKKFYAAGSATLSYPRVIESQFRNQSPFVSQNGDELDSAYYTYSTTTRFKPNSTFR